MKSYPQCETRKSDKKIPLEEKRSKITFLNPQQQEIVIIEVDDCVITGNQTLRCDYMVLPSHQQVEIYVELKGCDIEDAVKQIKSTIKLLSSNPKKIKKLCFIVSTRVPKLQTSIQQLKVEFKNDFKAQLHVKNIQCEYDLSKAT